MPGLIATVDALLSPIFDRLSPGAASGLRLSQRADLQVDGALALARSLGRPPRQVAEEVVAAGLDRGLGAVCQGYEVAGPGFINLTLSADFLAQALKEMADGGDNLGAAPKAPATKVVVDYAGPNMAKEMHVGHLRSTIIGDCLVRLFSLSGMTVVRENHVGDWGASFGMLLEHLMDVGEGQAAEELAMGELEQFYQQARLAYDNKLGFAERARARVVLLQSGDPETLRLWRLFIGQSIEYFQGVLRLLGTRLTRDDVVGESYYNPLLPGVVSELQKSGLLVESQGARCVFPPGYHNREGQPLPLIVQNSAGGYTYAATDLAAVRDRVARLGADLLVYVVGLPQSEHLQMVFDTARLAGWLPPGTEAVHVGFGSVLGPDGKMLRTRQGGTVKLGALLNEAVERARAVISERDQGPEGLAEADIDAVARAVGIGAVKYADLSTDRARDYRFDWDRMLAFDGNTAPYLQYAHARTRRVAGRAAEQGIAAPGPDAFLPPGAPEERELAKKLLSFADTLSATLETYSPHKLCNYLFDLASSFTGFYENCPVLKAGSPEVRASRLALCDLSGRVLSSGLDLLGIEAPERM